MALLIANCFLVYKTIKLSSQIRNCIYLLTPWSRVLLEKVTRSQLVRKFPAFNGTRSLITAEIKCQLDATEVFIADLIACSTCFGHHYAHHQELKSIKQWLLPVVFRAVVFKLLVWCGAEGYVSGLQDAAETC